MQKLFEAKKKFPVIKKDAINPFFKSGYATLSNIIEIVEPELAKSGLFITSLMAGNELITKIVDGETGTAIIESRFTLPVNGDIQKIGSAITYARRYNLVAMLNLNVEEDDDGNSAKQKQETKSFKLTAHGQDVEASLITATTLDELKAVAGKIKDDKKLTGDEKTYLRTVYTQQEGKLK